MREASEGPLPERLLRVEPRGTAGPRPSRAVGAAGLVAGLVAAWIVATSDHLLYAAPFAVLDALQVWSSIAIGLIYWAFRPHSRVGSLLIAYGFVNALIGLEGSSQPLISAAGAIAEVPAVVLIVSLILAARRQKLDATSRWVLGAWSGLVIAEYAVWISSHPSFSVPTPLTACVAHCPSNPLFIPAAASAFAPILPWLDPVYRVSIFLLLTGVFLMYLPRLRQSATERQVMLPVLTIFSVWLIGSTLYGASQLSARESAVVFWVLYVGRLIFPASFAAGLLSAQSLGARAIEKVLVNADADRHASETARVAQALGVDSLVASDVAIAQDRDLFEAAARAIALMIDKRTLEAELERTRASYDKTRTDLAQATESERQRIERDLHDSVQQDLLATAAHLEIVRALVRDEAVRERLTSIRDDIALLLERLRDIAHGVPVVSLRQHGLRAALAEAAQRTPAAVRLTMEGPERYPLSVEEAIYYCCLEAVQNARKHGGRFTQVAIQISGSASAVTFRIRDDGPGFDQGRTVEGQGMRNMFERMNAVGGWLMIESAIGKGTTISGGVTFDATHSADSDTVGE